MLSNNKRYRSFEQIVNLFYNEDLKSLEETKDNKKILKEKIKIEPRIIYEKTKHIIKIEVFIGTENMYQIKKLSTFYDMMLNKELYKYNNDLEFVHVKESFAEEDYPILDFVLKYAEVIKYANTYSKSNYRINSNMVDEGQIILDPKSLDDLFEILKNKNIKVKNNTIENTISFIPKSPDVKFYLNKLNEEELCLEPSIDLLKVDIIKGNKYTYILTKSKLYRCDKSFEKTTMKLVEAFKKNYSSKVTLSKEQLYELFSIIMPKVKDNLIIQEEDKKDFKKYMPKKLVTQIYLDFDKNNYIIADLRFVYDQKEYNPLESDIKKQISRNIIEENKMLNMLVKTGFMLDSKNNRFVLADEEKIYNFITENINIYMENMQVLATDNFKSKQIKRAKIESLGIKIENNLLEINFKKLNIDPKEIIDIMKKYKLKKKFYRLKDGSFLELKKDKNIEFLDKLIDGTNISVEDFKSGVIHLPIYRTVYLDKLLKSINKQVVDTNDEYNKVINSLDQKKIGQNIEIPYNIEKTLRHYQKVGFQWLKILDKYKLGGILADDMGLGKTIQILSVILSYIENEKEETKRASIVVAPSSLTLNWQNEIEKFAKNIKTVIIQGKLEERKAQIQNIENYDLVITSYDLLKRDIELYNEKNYKFRYIIADEAQHLKNSNTQNAICIKQINADTKYALTGTPMENSLAELWSIFDFIMPGYLFSYRRFKNLFEVPIVKEKDLSSTEKLKMLIEPFVLRRTKKEVLTELPEKVTTIFTSYMEEEQKKLYMSYLAQAKEEVKEAIDLNGYEKSQMKILSILTRLRQICCHPSLFIENYNSGSSKLEQCMEIVKDGVGANHKILIFSGYASMFPIIEEELKKFRIKYYKLTGDTKIEDRVNLVDKFNKDKNVNVFLISLKAGGTGLNLTGADMVIHYDPWWNASAENQATDRAYRIGQKNNVQVYKLITKDSIEEKIYKLQQNKSELIDNVLNINTSFINKLSKEDIMGLFE